MADDNVVDLRINQKPEGGPHIEGRAICAACRHEWHSVSPVGTTELECPSCHAMRGHSMYEVTTDEHIFICGECDGFMFKVTASGILCMGCGTKIGFDQLAEVP